MDLYKKIKEFTEICPVSTNIGEYLKDASKVCNIYYEMLALDDIEAFENVKQKELELEQAMTEILKQWEL